MAAAVVALCSLWPGVQHLLVRGFDVSAEALYGLAADARPNLAFQVRVEALQGDVRRPLDAQELPVDFPQDLRAFRNDAARLGRLVRPDTLAQRVLAAAPRLAGLVVTTSRLDLRAQTAKVGLGETDFEYRRRGATLEACVIVRDHAVRTLMPAVESSGQR